MKTIYDIAVIGAGAVGSAIARELSRYQLKVALIESNPDVGMGTSKASTAIWHTGFDAKPGTLEATLMRRSYALMDTYMPEANIPHERLGAVLIAWNQDQLDSLPALEKKAHDNGVMDVKIISVDEVYRREPNINKGALGGLLVPGEGILCTFSVPLAYATQAVVNGVELFVNFQVKGIKQTVDGGTWTVASADNEIQARYVVNAAGLYSDEINAMFGHAGFTVTPRRGQLIVYDKLARPLVNHVLLPVPTSKTKGVLISPTVYGNILLGPTAEDLPDKTATQTTADGFELLLGKGREILPQLLDEEVTATYAGLRAATEHSDYQIAMYADQRYLCVGGIRSTGISSAMGIAEYAVELLSGAGVEFRLKDEFKSIRLPTIGQADIRPHQSAEMIAKNPQYAEMVCHCERVSRGELIDAMNGPIPATVLDALRRRTRASQGRCQGFNCHAALVKDLTGFRKSTITQASPVKPVRSTAEVLIVGAGPAGLSAAIELKKQGIKDILVVDREPEAGGMPRFCDHIGFGVVDLWRLYTGPRYARYYRELAEKYDVEVRTSTTITGWNNRKLTFTSPSGLGEIEARAVLLATGIRERPRAARMVPGTRPQGVYTTGSLQRFVHQEELPVGKRAVIVGAELVSLSALLTLTHARTKCVGMVTEEATHQVEFPYVAMKWGMMDILRFAPLITNARVTNIFGHKRVEGIEITRANNQTEMIECDSVIFTGSWISENEMARLGGLTIDSATKAPKIDSSFRSSVDGVFVAGNLLRGGKSVYTADKCTVEGTAAGKAIAKFLK
ncbi:MAG: FAD-dependent oxidoreductase [Chloroflexi bacterium]|nr:FAD-dependent oxidoreductase [Chloroflexota bacterium]